MDLNKKVAQILGEDSISDDTILKDLDSYDSLNILSIIAFIKKEYGISFNAADIDQIKTIKDIKEKIKKYE